MSERISEEQKDLAIEAYVEHGNLVSAGRAAGVSSKTLYREKKRSAAFNKEMNEAKEIYCEKIKDKLDQMTTDGKATHTQFLATVAIARANMPEYKDKTEHSGEVNIKIVSAIPRPEEKK